jgi:hypothetical protein
MNDLWYSVHIEAQAPPGAAVAPDEASADELMGMLEEYSGVVAAGDSSWSATITVPAADVRAATDIAVGVVEEMARKAGMPQWPLTRADAVRQDVLEAESARPTLPEIVSAPEAADILGVSQQRVRELASTAPEFPEPVYQLRTGKLWLRAAIEAYAARRPRTPGRRPAVSPQPSAVSLAARAIFVQGPAAWAGGFRGYIGIGSEGLWGSAPTHQLRMYLLAVLSPHGHEQSWRLWKARPADQAGADVRCLAWDALAWADADRGDIEEVLSTFRESG